MYIYISRDISIDDDDDDDDDDEYDEYDEFPGQLITGWYYHKSSYFLMQLPGLSSIIDNWYRMAPPVISWFTNHYNPH